MHCFIISSLFIDDALFLYTLDVQKLDSVLADSMEIIEIETLVNEFVG